MTDMQAGRQTDAAAGAPAAVSDPVGLPARARAQRAGFTWLRPKRIVYLRDVTVHLVGRELTARYRRSLLGWLWSLAPPLMQLAVFQFVFTRVIPLNVAHFALFLLVGILAWNWFSLGVSLATASLEARRDLVLRPGFPTVLLPLVSVLVGLVDYLIALPVLLVALAVTTGLHASVLLLPALLALQLLLTAGLGWLLAPVQAYFRDVRHFVSVALMLGFWLTPVFYARTHVPERFSVIYDLNPMAHLIEAQRAILLDGRLPGAGTLGLVALAALAVFALGLATFSVCRHSLPEQL